MRGQDMPITTPRWAPRTWRYGRAIRPVGGCRACYDDPGDGEDLRYASDGLELELPFEGAGAVAVTGVRRLLATQVLVSLVGRGPAPF